MITQQKQIAQASAPQIWDKATASAQVGDYIRMLFTPVMLVADRDELEDGRVWLLLKPVTASYTEEWLLEPEAPAVEAQSQPATEPQPQPAVLAGDKVSCQLQPATEAETEFEQGCQHGRNDALAGWHPIYKEPVTEYATGYLAGYNFEVLNPRTQQPETVKSAGWSATWDDKWQCYRVWAGARYNRYVGSATTYQEAERLGQQDAALDKTIKRQNAAVLAAYASVVAN